MNKKNSLTQFKKPGAPILPETRDAPPPPPAPEPTVPRGKTGPRPKPASQKRSHRVMLSLTPGEAAISRRRAGLAGEATVIMAFLKDHGYFE